MAEPQQPRWSSWRHDGGSADWCYGRDRREREGKRE
ncbi:hypothetical protein TIFTF001_053628, partial [Ficus carica]